MTTYRVAYSGLQCEVEQVQLDVWDIVLSGKYASIAKYKSHNLSETCGDDNGDGDGDDDGDGDGDDGDCEGDCDGNGLPWLFTHCKLNGQMRPWTRQKRTEQI